MRNPTDFDPQYVDALAGTGPVDVRVLEHYDVGSNDPELLVAVHAQGIEVLLAPSQVGPLVLALLAAGNFATAPREVRRPTEDCAEPESDGIGGGL